MVELGSGVLEAIGRGEAVIVAEGSGLVDFEREGEMVVVRVADG